jgi:hypothetical protein
MSTRPSDKPPAVSLNLDTLEREGEKPEPFVVVLDGKPMTFADPSEMAWQEVMAALRDPEGFFRYALSKEDSERFLSTKLPTWKLNRMMEQWREHYGVPDPGKPGASPGS